MVEAKTAFGGGKISTKEILTILAIFIIPILFIVLYTKYAANKAADTVKDKIADVFTVENAEKATDAIIKAPFKIIQYGEDTADRVSRGVGTKSISGEDYSTPYRAETYEEFVDRQGTIIETTLRVSGVINRVGDKLLGGDTLGDAEKLGERFGDVLRQKGWFGY